MQSFFNKQNNFHQFPNFFLPSLLNNQNSNSQGLNQISNQLDILNINSEIYFFNRKMKSRFFNENENEEEKKIDFENISTNSDSFSYNSDKENKNFIQKKHDVMQYKQKNKKKIKSLIKIEKNGKSLKGFKERDGDWTCYYCKNLNFKFRNECNRCHITKEISDKGHEKYFQDVLNQINVNEEERKNSKFNN
jgi:hypothetical protein